MISTCWTGCTGTDGIHALVPLERIPRHVWWDLWTMSPLTGGFGCCSRLELQQQLVSNPAKVLQRLQESVESPRSTVRQDVQQLESFLSVGGQRVDMLHLSLAQNVLLVQKRNDGIADQELTGQLQPVLPQQSSVFPLHVNKPRVEHEPPRLVFVSEMRPM